MVVVYHTPGNARPDVATIDGIRKQETDGSYNVERQDRIRGEAGLQGILPQRTVMRSLGNEHGRAAFRNCSVPIEQVAFARSLYLPGTISEDMQRELNGVLFHGTRPCDIVIH
jgi:hypothetical protein